jgi:small-conductance mechanosensitive channel
MIHGLFGSGLDGWHLTAALLAAGALAYLAAEIAARAFRSLLIAVSGDTQTEFRSPLVRRPIRLMRALVFVMVFALLAVPALKVAGADIRFGHTAQALSAWAFGAGLRIPIIVLLGYALIRIIAAAARRLEDTIGQVPTATTATVDAVERFKRARTLSGLLQKALTSIVIVIAVLMVLQQLQINIVPILTGAGILGLAVGFGAQTLVKDLISGFFLILENQVRVGDVATINGTGGLVEEINLRTVVLRDLNGTVHVFPNGSIERLSNLSKDFAYSVLDVGVAYKEDPDVVMAALREIGAELASRPAYQLSILEPIEILGVDALGESQLTIKIRFKTLPLKQWEIGRELRRRIKKGFDQRGIEIPFPQLSISFAEESKPFVVRQTG